LNGRCYFLLSGSRPGKSGGVDRCICNIICRLSRPSVSFFIIHDPSASGSSRHIAVEYRAIIIVCQYPPYSLQDNMLQRLSPMALVNCEDTSPMWNIFDQNLRPNGVGLVQNIGVFHCRSATPLARSVWATRRKGLTPQPGCCVQQRHFPCLTRMENSEYRKVVSNRNERLFIIKGLTLQPPLFASHSFRHCCLWVH
jgi:hypothetical protein